MLHNKKRSNVAGNNEKEVVSNTSAAGTSSNAITFDEDMVVCDILSRIPAKSLMRFKCVSKPWCFLIKDPYFIDLHSTRSKTLLRFFFVIPLVGNDDEAEHDQTEGIYYQHYQLCFKTTGFLSEESGREASIIPTIRNLRSVQCTEIIGAVNGLICFVNDDVAACIYNISTREITPWITSTVLTEYRENRTWCSIGGPSYCFGYDPATKKHKVMCMWNMSQKQDDGSFLTGPVCEVLTLGHNSWRKIEAVPPQSHFYHPVCSTYVNGSVYWVRDRIPYGGWNNGDDVFVVAFDVGSETFRTIRIFKYISGTGPSAIDTWDRCHLLEVNGCVAISCRISADIVKLRIYEDSDKESTYKATTLGTDWTENTITLPVRWVEGRDLYFHTAGGTDQMILETHTRSSDRRSKAVSIYSYDLKKKTFEEIKISGIPLSVPDYFNIRICTSFCESLLSLSEA